MSDNNNSDQTDKIVPNPVVEVPEGNFNAGKTLFQDLCQSCHKMRVCIDLSRVMVKALMLLQWETLWEEEQAQPNTITGRP